MESTTSDEQLRVILEHVHSGRIQVPEFQRAWSWDDARIRGLVASVSLGYPIGALTLLDAGSSDMRFDSHPVTGAPAQGTAPERFLIDGLQRVTALYQVFRSQHPVQTFDDGGNPVELGYYADLAASVEPEVDRDDAIRSIPAVARTQHLDATDWEHAGFPLRLIFGDQDERARWMRGYESSGPVSDAARRRDLVARFESQVLRRIESYVLPVIRLDRESTRWSVRVHGGPDGPERSDAYRLDRPRNAATSPEGGTSDEGNR